MVMSKKSRIVIVDRNTGQFYTIDRKTKRLAKKFEHEINGKTVTLFVMSAAEIEEVNQLSSKARELMVLLDDPSVKALMEAGALVVGIDETPKTQDVRDAERAVMRAEEELIRARFDEKTHYVVDLDDLDRVV
jgi:2,3-bisphosphoglycerate-independent phosphoglycerate mutase